MGMAAYKENVPGTRESPVVRGLGVYVDGELLIKRDDRVVFK